MPNTIQDVYERLRAAFGPQHWWPGESAFEVLVGAVLTQNTSWRNVERAIETGGSSISDFVAPDGQDGAYQDERQVYAREGAPCYSSGEPTRKQVVPQRGTHYCPRCQR